MFLLVREALTKNMEIRKKLMNPSSCLLSVMLIMAITSCWPQVKAVAADVHPPENEDGCERRCGNVYIPRPFGIGPAHCYFNESFAVSCNKSSSSSLSSSIAVLSKYNLEILEVLESYNSTMRGIIKVKIPSITACGGGGNSSSSSSNSTSESIESWWTSPNLTGSPFIFQSGDNVFVSAGCHGYAVLYNETGGVAGGCSSACAPNPPLPGLKVPGNGFRCCRTDVEVLLVDKDLLGLFSDHGLRQYSIGVTVSKGSRGCRSGFLTSSDYFQEKAPCTPEITAVPVLIRWRAYSFSVIGGLFLLCGGIFFGCWRCKTKRRRKEIKLRAKYFNKKLEELRCSDEEAIEKTKLFTLAELKRATNNFSRDYILGRGGQGTVFKGVLKDGQVIAVKRSREFVESQWMQFINEVILLSQIKHRHVVKLLGCCLETNVPLVVYEYLPNGTLSEHIHGSTKESLLTWEMRLRIASESVNAVAYLHSGCPTPIYHRDIKSSNILLDDKYRAKLSDFGISRALCINQTHFTTCVQGTLGYLDPEYFCSSQFSEKSDVYSFGVVLIELLTGQKPFRSSAIEEEDKEISLVVYFTSSINNSTVYNILDPLILQDAIKEDIMVVANLAYQCVNPRGAQRPTMKEVARVLAVADPAYF